MYRFHIKSLVLGIGLGIVITSIISLIYMAGADPTAKLSEDEAVKLAEKYGMVKSSSLIQGTQPQKAETTKQSESTKQNGTNIVTVTPTPAPKPAAGQAVIKLSIVQGDTAEKVTEKLFSAGLISDKAAFVQELSNMKLTDSILTGDFNIKKGADIKEIIRAITEKK